MSTTNTVEDQDIKADEHHEDFTEMTEEDCYDKLGRLTNKKRQYLETAIIDKNGAYQYLDDPVEYKKARKRLQNRESAVRSRMRKKSYQDQLEYALAQKQVEMDGIAAERDTWRRRFEALQAENAQLRGQIAVMQSKGPAEGTTGSLIGGQNVINIAVTTAATPPTSTQSNFGTEVSQSDLQALKDDILSDVDKRISSQYVNEKTFDQDDDTRTFSDNLSSCKKSDWEKLTTEMKTDKGPMLYQQFKSAAAPAQADDMEFDDAKSSDDDSDGLFDRTRSADIMEQCLSGSSRSTKRTRVKSGSKRQRRESSPTKQETEESPESMFFVERRRESIQTSSLFMLAMIACVICCTAYMNGNMDNGRIIFQSKARQLLTVFNGEEEAMLNTSFGSMQDPVIQKHGRSHQSFDLLDSDVSDQIIPDVELLMQQQELKERDELIN